MQIKSIAGTAIKHKISGKLELVPFYQPIVKKLRRHSSASHDNYAFYFMKYSSKGKLDFCLETFFLSVCTDDHKTDF